jgi:16S rRNA (cytidine1402-2'-O)-methyltransferase
MSGTLYVVPTPIGRLDDLSPRAREVLATVPVVAAEDTRVTRKLFQELGLPVPRLLSNHDHNERGRADQVVQLLAEGLDVAVVSDAGTPLVSDPGYRAVVAAVAAGAPVVPLPGPCAVPTALSACGLPTDRFVFLGFPPRKGVGTWLEARRGESATLVFFESPHRLVATLEAVQQAWGPRRVCVARSLTKSFEDFLRGTPVEVAGRLAAETEAEGRLLGEFTVVVEGADAEADAGERARAHELVRTLVAAGVSSGVVRDAVASTFGLPRREVYQWALAAGREEEG